MKTARYIVTPICALLALVAVLAFIVVLSLRSDVNPGCKEHGGIAKVHGVYRYDDRDGNWLYGSGDVNQKTLVVCADGSLVTP